MPKSHAVPCQQRVVAIEYKIDAEYPTDDETNAFINQCRAAGMDAVERSECNRTNGKYSKPLFFRRVEIRSSCGVTTVYPGQWVVDKRMFPSGGIKTYTQKEFAELFDILSFGIYAKTVYWETYESRTYARVALENGVEHVYELHPTPWKLDRSDERLYYQNSTQACSKARVERDRAEANV